MTFQFKTHRVHSKHTYTKIKLYLYIIFQHSSPFFAMNSQTFIMNLTENQTNKDNKIQISYFKTLKKADIQVSFLDISRK